MITPRNRNLIMVCLLLAYAVYAGLFIWRTSFVIGGERTFSLFDDGMISMRYAKNLAAGAGPVWNAGGERVEGYTNPLWMAYMALFHLLPIPASKISLAIQLSGALFLLLNLLVVIQIGKRLSGRVTLAVLFGALLTAFYLPLNNWALQGMEVSVLTLIVSLAIWLSIRGLRDGAFSVWPYALLGVGTLIRLDAAVPYVALLIFMIVAQPTQRRRHLLAGLIILAACLGSQTLFRLAYYGDIVPNTYHLKVEGYPTLLRIGYGLYYAFDFVLHMNWVLFLVPFSLLIFKRDKPILLLFWVFLAQVAYSVYVGGDAWEWWGGSNRYISIVMPLFFVLFGLGLAQIVGALRSVMKSGMGIKLINYGVLIFALIAFVNINLINSETALAEWTLAKPVLHAEDNQKMAEQAQLIDRLTTPQARVAVVYAGVLPYFADRTMIDLLGKSDKVIAHEPMHSGLGFYPGHLKWDYAYSIGQLKPDVVAQLWQLPDEAKPYLTDYQPLQFRDMTMYLLKGSPNIHWDQVPP